MKKDIKWIVSFLVCLMLLTSILPVLAQGAEINGDGRTGDLTIDYKYQGTPLSGAEFYGYRVAEITENQEYILAGAFRDCTVELNGLSDSERMDAAETLYGYAQLDGIEPDAAAVTGPGGRAVIDELPVGLYLIAGKPLRADGGIYTTSPQLVAIPSEIDGIWAHSLILSPKCDFEPEPEKPVCARVQKIWKDAGNQDDRPEYVVVYLLQDGGVYDMVSLSKENRWRYVWEELPAGHVYTVVEQVPEGYGVSVVKLGSWTVIVNTRIPETPTEPSEPPTEPSEPSIPSQPTEPVEPSDPTQPTKPVEPTSPEEPSVPTTPTVPAVPTEPTEPTQPPVSPELPQTGLLWWPVPLMLIVGLILLILGAGLA